MVDEEPGGWELGHKVAFVWPCPEATLPPSVCLPLEQRLGSRQGTGSSQEEGADLAMWISALYAPAGPQAQPLEGQTT